MAYLNIAGRQSVSDFNFVVLLFFFPVGIEPGCFMHGYDTMAVGWRVEWEEKQQDTTVIDFNWRGILPIETAF